MMRRCFSVLALMASLGVMGCTKRGPAPSHVAESDTLQAASELTQATLSPNDEPALYAQLAPLLKREVCNRITGCEALTTFMQQSGEEGVKAAIYALDPKRATDGYWRLVLLTELGRQASPLAEKALVGFLTHNKWELPIRAALSLSYRGPALSFQSRQALAQALVPDLDSGDLARNMAILVPFVQAREPELPPNRVPLVGEPRRLLIELIPSGQALIDTPHPQLDVFVSVVRDAKLNERLDVVRYALRTANRFVSDTALATAKQFGDTGSIGPAIMLLEHQSPIIRRQAADTLKAIVGSKFPNFQAWKAFADRNGIEVPSLPERY